MKKVAFIILIFMPILLTALLFAGFSPYRVYAIRTGSMSPKYPSKTAVLVRVGSYRVGQVVTYKKEDGLITHRLMAISAAGFITTKGDANPTPDPWHEKISAIVGGVVASVPSGGYWLIYLKNPAGFGSFIDLAIIVWLIWDLATIADSKRAKSTQRTEVRAIEKNSEYFATGAVPLVVYVDGITARRTARA